MQKFNEITGEIKLKKTLFFLLIVMCSIAMFPYTALAQEATRPIVRLIYFRASDTAPRPNVDAEIDALIKKTQLFFADEMERHGFGRKTFQFETDDSGNALVHHTVGKFTYAHYLHNRINRNEEDIELFIPPQTGIYVVMFDTHGAKELPGHICGIGGGNGVTGSAINYCWDWGVIAHELGHAFGMVWHDFRGPAYIMSYSGEHDGLSKCSAELLNVNPAFNTEQNVSKNQSGTIKMLPPSLAAPPNGIRLRFEVTHPDGLYQAILRTPETEPRGFGGGMLGCQLLNGQSSTIEFITTGLPTKNKDVSLVIIDVHGNFTWSQSFPIDIPSLLPPSKTISIPDPHLAAAVRREIGTITTHAMLNLSFLNASNANIQDLTGIEYAYNLRSLSLAGEYIEGEGNVNSNTVSDLSPLSGLTQLTSLSLGNSNISDISALSELKNMSWLDLYSNNISDISALAGLTNLNTLYLDSNNISDISALAGLTNLNTLYLDSNNISDISALAGLTNLTRLNLDSNNISDISVISELKNMSWLDLGINNISDISALSELENMTTLSLDSNNISDISVISELKNMTTLSLWGNNISDISALAGSTNLTTLSLWNNNISDISALVGLNLVGTEWNKTGLSLDYNPLSYTAIYEHIPTMQSKGIEISFSPRTPTTVEIISGENQQVLTNAKLPLPFVVEVRDQNKITFAEVPVTFTIIEGDGKLSETSTTTDAKGRTQTYLTFGENIGETTVKVAAAQIKEPVTFTATAIPLDLPVTMPNQNLHAKIAETLGKSVNGQITVADLLTLTKLDANNANINDLTGLEHASNLTTLHLNNNSITDAKQILGLTQLRLVSLDNNRLSDVTALGQLTALDTLSLRDNDVNDISGLTQLPQLQTLNLTGNLLDYPSLNTHIPLLQAQGTVVSFDNRTPTKIHNESAPHAVAGNNAVVRVKVTDENGRAFAGVPVTFTLTPISGVSYEVEGVTGDNGDAATGFKIGATPGENKVQADVKEIPQSLSFSITGLDVNLVVQIPDTNLLAKIKETLNLPAHAEITTGDMMTLTRLYMPNANIQDLTGLEYAYNLTNLGLNGEYIDGQGRVNTNRPTDFSPIQSLTRLVYLNLSDIPGLNLSEIVKLTQLTSLRLSNNNISDISVLSELKNMTTLSLGYNNISDISALAGLTNLDTLYLWNNNISDISVLSELKNITSLSLWGNNISDISALAELTNLTYLDLSNNNISDISTLSELKNMTNLRLGGNNISDISVLSELKNMSSLSLWNNNISDISALAGLTNLNTLDLYGNNISDISALVGLNLVGTEWDKTGLYLDNNPLNYTAIYEHIPTMQSKGIEVSFTPRTPTTIEIISGENQQALTNSKLPLPFVVEVRDQNKITFAEVPVTFTITEGDGKLSETSTTTDAKGRAQTYLTLGKTLGDTTVKVTAAHIKAPVTFTATAIPLDLPVPIPDQNLHAKIAETLGKSVNGQITVTDMLTLTELHANNANINDLTGLEHASNLTTLYLNNNSITDTKQILGLTQLRLVSLDNNQLSDVTALGQLTALDTLSLRDNDVNDISGLTQLPQLQTLDLAGNLLDYPSLNTHIPVLQAQGTVVSFDNRTPTKIHNESASHSVAGDNAVVRVKVTDENGSAFAGVPVTFTLTPIGGSPYEVEVVTADNGYAATGFWIGATPGENKVQAQVKGIPQSLSFSITGITLAQAATRPIVRLIYFRASDTALRPNVDAEIDALIKKAQLFFADEMERHGFGRKTFQFETDDSGNALVHHTVGKYTYAHYLHNSINSDEEDIELFIPPQRGIYVTMFDTHGAKELPHNVCGFGGGNGVTGSAINYCWNWGVIAHELGHAFGMVWHDFRGPAYIMSYSGEHDGLSKCSAELLNVNPAFNTEQNVSKNQSGTIKMLPPSLAAPPNGIRLRFEVTHPDGLYQAILRTPETEPRGFGGGMLGCQLLNGQSSTIEFITTGLPTKNKDVSLVIIDVHGNFTWSQSFPIDIPSLLPPSKTISIPDPHLAAAVRREIGTITTHSILNLSGFHVPNSGITDLTGLEHAHSLKWLHLGAEYIEGEGNVNSNTVSDLSPLSGLTQLTNLNLRGNNISDISALAELTNLTYLDLSNNNISDISALSELKNLWSLELHGNNISDISALSELKNLIYLDLRGNNISDISALTELTNLITLWLGNNNISDISVISKLKNIGSLELYSNNISDISVISELKNMSRLDLSSNNISDISALSELKNISYLRLYDNNISDISVISELKNMSWLDLGSNNITDISMLAELKNMRYLNLWNNNISDISALVGLNLVGTEWNKKGLSLDYNPLNYTAIYEHIPTMQSKGIEISFSPRTPTTVEIISGENQQVLTNAKLPLPFVVEVRDQNKITFAEVPVTFTITEGDGELSETSTTTDAKGRTQTYLTFGENIGETTVKVTAAHIKEPVTFTATAIPLDLPVTMPNQNLQAKIAETLGKPLNGQITVADMLTLTKLDANNANINDLTGLEHASNLTTLYLNNNSITDAKQILGLTQLRLVSLDNNQLSDITALSQLTALDTLSLRDNDVNDISSLTQLPQLQTLDLAGNLLDYPSLNTHIPALQAQGTVVSFDNRTPTKIHNESDLHAVAGNNAVVRVKVTDENGSAFAGVPVTFTLTPIGGSPYEVEAVTGDNGNAATGFKMGSSPGENKVQAQVMGISQSLSFSITGLDVNLVVHIPDTNLLAKIKETLNLPAHAEITTGDMMTLTSLYMPNANIQDLTGMEYAYNLSHLGLNGEYIDGQGRVNTNRPTDFSPIQSLTRLVSLNLSDIPGLNLSEIAKLTQLTSLNLSSNNISDISVISELKNISYLRLYDNNISDISVISELKNMSWLDLGSNNISDISVLSELKNMSSLYLYDNNISDISALAELKNMTTLHLGGNNISDISALAELKNMTTLHLGGNNISDISALAELKNMTTLHLWNNNISDISALAGLTNLNTLNLDSNNISDVSPLVKLNLTGTEWNRTGLHLRNNPLSYVSINTHIPAMQAEGIEVQYSQRTPTKLLKISGDAQQAVTNSELPLPFVVEVRDQNNRAFAEVPVTFSITKGSGKLSATTAKTDKTGRAQTQLTLGQTGSPMTVQASAPNVSQSVQFIATSISLDSTVTLSDANLSAKIAETFDKPTDAPITMGDMLALTSLTANNAGISNLTGLQHASNLTTLRLNSNNLSNIDALTGLTQLTTLSLDNNNLSNIAPLVELTQLETLSLENNNLSDVAPLVELTELKTLHLRGNLLSYPSLYTTIPTLRSHGVDVVFDTRTPTTLINIPGPSGVAGTLLQVIVQVQDQKGVAFSGVPVNFTLTASGGHRSTSKAISRLNGKAATTLTLGPEPGENTVSATVTEIPQPLNFTITAIDGDMLVHIPDVNLHTKIAETLNKPKSAKLKAGDLLELTRLDARNADIQDLTGLEHASKLDWLNLDSNNISDISALSGLTNLTQLYLFNNNISDTSALSALTNLTHLHLRYNNISDMSPLLALNLTGTQWDSTGLDIRNNPLNNEAIRTHIPAMQARGIVLSFDNITHPEFLIISGDKQEELVGRTLPAPFVVEYRDANGNPKEEVKVTFAITDGDAELTDTTVTTDADGRAQTFLRVEWKLGTITVSVTAEGINYQLTFIAHVVLPENHVAEDVNADGVVDVEDLVLVAATMGTTPPENTLPNPDVNGDGVVNSDDLALVMAALENTPTAPAAAITAENLQKWIDEAKQLTNKDATFLRGIRVLEELLAALLPKNTELLANYPNPFNPETWIPYHLAKPADVTLHIYGVDGVLVRTLSLGQKSAGIYEGRTRAAYWDGRNTQGERVASGIYFYTLTADTFTATRKMLIRK